jgi:hypothetical protein
MQLCEHWIFLAGIAAQCAAQPVLQPERAQLVQIRERMQQNQAHIPNYTCLETIDRGSRPPRSLVIDAHGGRGRFLAQDVVRLEVAYVDGREFFAVPGAYNFAEPDVTTFSAGGMIGSGLFVGFARNIFNSALAGYQFAGETNDAARPMLRYNYQVPFLLNTFKLRTTFGEADVGYSGFFWADARSFDVARLDIQADDIPPNLGLVSTDTRIDYAWFHIGTTDVLLPQSAETTMHMTSDWVFRNRVSFTHCKAYSAQSEISFEAHSVSTSAAPPPPREIEIPANLTLATRLNTALVSETSRVGDSVSARIDADVMHKGTVLIPKGTIVTGRIRTFDRYVAPSHYYRIALEFYRFEFPRGPVRFFAEMESIDNLAQSQELPARGRAVNRRASGRVHATILRTPELPGVGTFTISGDTVLVPPGTRMIWRTRPYAH